MRRASGWTSTRRRWSGRVLGEGVEVASGDFLDPSAWPLAESSFDAIIANPPYIRHHNLPAEHKARAAQYGAELQIKVSGLSGSYVYFFLEAILRLNVGGRLVFITPTEFLDVRYGQAVKEALISRCPNRRDPRPGGGRVGVRRCADHVGDHDCHQAFEEPTKRLRLSEGRFDRWIERKRSIELPVEHASPASPWTPLLPSRAERIAPLLKGRNAKLGDYCKVRRGIATGDNSFFCLSAEDVERLGIEQRFLVPVVIGSRDLPEDGPLDEDFRNERIAGGARCFLFRCYEPREALEGTNALRHIESGEEVGLHERFNCRTGILVWGREGPASRFFCHLHGPCSSPNRQEPDRCSLHDVSSQHLGQAWNRS